MNLSSFLKQREIFQNQAETFRDLCTKCLQPQFGCYCTLIHKFDPKIKFVILMHPIEMKRRIATGRMSHLSLSHSELLIGQDYSNVKRVNDLLNDQCFQHMVLYPGFNSSNITEMNELEKNKLFDSNKTQLVFVIDGTWATARKMMSQSFNLKSLPRISFTPPTLSQFRVRKQPNAQCYSTIEAIHHCIELVGPHVGFDVTERKHDTLLNVFNSMVEKQLEFVREAFDNPKSTSYRRPKVRVA